MNVRALAVMVLLSACSPTLTPVVGRQPLVGSSHPPRIIWLFDQSGSMYAPVDPASPLCSQGCGVASNPCPDSCFTRESMLRAGVDTMSALIPAWIPNTAIRYPTDSLCGAPGDSEFYPEVSFYRRDDLAPSDLHDVLAAYVPTGGTPTAKALRYVASLPVPSQTETFVVLVTDGLPNCNDNNPYNVCAQPTDQTALAACRCTIPTCSVATLCSKGCLDDFGAISASHALVESGMSLMVIGLGADLQSGIGISTLGTLEIALPPSCTSSADCGGRTCNADGVCADRLFLAAAPADFDAPARRLARAVHIADRCTWWLPRQVAAADLTVEIGSDVLDPSEWTLKGEQDQRVVISGAACDRLIAGTESVSFSLPPSN